MTSDRPVMEKLLIKITSATLDDLPVIFSFIQKKIAFDRNIGAYSGIPTVTQEKLRKTLFGAIPFSYVLFAEITNHKDLGELTNPQIGFALYEFRYSSFVGQPSIWLNDLFVDEAMRSQGAGATLMAHLVQIARSQDCTHLAWNADARNTRGLSFYQRLGAEIIEQKGTRCWLQLLNGSASF
jgi:GNAT superfamily N-acetyltransferase